MKKCPFKIGDIVRLPKSIDDRIWYHSELMCVVSIISNVLVEVRFLNSTKNIKYWKTNDMDIHIVNIEYVSTLRKYKLKRLLK